MSERLNIPTSAGETNTGWICDPQPQELALVYTGREGEPQSFYETVSIWVHPSNGKLVLTIVGDNRTTEIDIDGPTGSYEVN